MTYLRTRKQRGRADLAIRMTNFQVGWRAYMEDKHGNVMIIAVGRDVFHCSSVGQAMKIAVKQIPTMISAPGAQIGFRYVREQK